MKLKKVWAILLCVLLTLTPTALADTSAPGFGDLDQNNATDASDALRVLQASVGLINLTVEERVLGDVNADGHLNASDALLILQYSVGLVKNFEAEGGTFALNPYTGALSDTLSTPAKELDGIITTMQMQQLYSGLYELPADAVMVYIPSLSYVDQAFNSWKRGQDSMRVDYMLSAGRDDGEYLTLYPERGDMDCHVNQNGEYKYHPGGVHYMMPTEAYMEYKWRVVEQCLENNPGAIVLEEPETFNMYCYADGFKEAWSEYYGEPFADPALSPESRYKANKLFAHMWAEFVDEIGRRLKQTHPEVEYVIATHSISGYGSWDMTSSISDYTKSEYVDGIIAQVWSDAVNVPVSYAGDKESRPFETAYFDYGTFVAAENGKWLYTLCDAASDNDYSWELRRELWQETLVAQLMQPEVRRYQSIIWPDRSIGNASQEYKTEQLQAYTMQQIIGEYAATVYAGTQGISLAVSDSYSYHRIENMTTYELSDSFYGLSLPLVEKGIPLGAVSLDHLEDASDLKGVEVLLLTYDVMKPMSEQANQAIADWVRAGGVVLYLGGVDEWSSVDGEWWTEKNTTPYDDLVNKLGLELEAHPLEELTDFAWSGPSGFGSSILNKIVPYDMIEFSCIYEGGTPILEGYAGTLGVDCKIGEGHFLSVGLPSAYYGASVDGPQILRELVAYAVQCAGGIYFESDLMLVQRGSFVAAQAMRDAEPQVLRGEFIDLFDSEMTIKTEVILQAGESALLYNLSYVQEDGLPRLAHTGGILEGEVIEEADRTVFTIAGADNSIASTRLAGNGKTPSSITATLNGEEYLDIAARWENTSNTLLIQAIQTAGEPITITVEWSQDSRPDDPILRPTEEIVYTNQSNQDEAYLVRFTGNTYDRRYCDGNAELVYKLDLSEYDNPTVVLNVASNYLISVSDHDGDWLEAYNYKTMSGGQRIDGTGNRTALSIVPSKYISGDTVYIRLSSCEPSKGWGGCIYSFSIRYWETVD